MAVAREQGSRRLCYGRDGLRSRAIHSSRGATLSANGISSAYGIPIGTQGGGKVAGEGEVAPAFGPRGEDVKTIREIWDRPICVGYCVISFLLGALLQGWIPIP